MIQINGWPTTPNIKLDHGIAERKLTQRPITSLRSLEQALSDAGARVLNRHSTSDVRVYRIGDQVLTFTSNPVSPLHVREGGRDYSWYQGYFIQDGYSLKGGSSRQNDEQIDAWRKSTQRGRTRLEAQPDCERDATFDDNKFEIRQRSGGALVFLIDGLKMGEFMKGLCTDHSWPSYSEG
jgi:hypothetical protein